MTDTAIPAELLQGVSTLVGRQGGVIGGNSNFLAGTRDDPDSFNAEGGKTGDLGYYPMQMADGRVVYFPCLDRFTQIAALIVGSGGDPQLTIAGSAASSNAREYVYSGVVVDDDAVSQTVPNSGFSSKVNAFNADLHFGGPTARGGRHAVKGSTFQRAPTAGDNPDRNFVGVQGQSQTFTGDGGTPSAPLGAYFGMSSITQIESGAYGVFNATAFESNCVTIAGSTVQYRSGIQIADYVQTRGALIDAALSISAIIGPNLGARFGIHVGAQNGGNPLGSDSTLLRLDDTPVLANGIDMRNTAFTGSVFRTQNSDWTDGNLSLYNPNAGLELGSLSIAGKPHIDFHSSGTNVDYDSRIEAEGGNGGVGNGAISVRSIWFGTHTHLPLVDAGYDLGSAIRRWNNSYFANNPTVGSDARLKHTRGPISDAEKAVARGLPLVVFQYLDAVAAKGEDHARLHFGIIAQDLIAAFEAQGLDWRRYGVIGEDPVMEPFEVRELVDEPVTQEVTEDDERVEVVDGVATLIREPVTRRVPVVDHLPIVDTDGNPVMLPAIGPRTMPGERGWIGRLIRGPAEPVVTIPGTPERQATYQRPRTQKVERVVRTDTRPQLDAEGQPVTRYSVRYEQLAVMMLAALRDA
ncbi:tail fiber domain-containing protein [Sphingomonas arantia]|uniref:Tail fiber domain-containing protein n=1 Tax=Sphingomonas arantia TaxID=1460676 RepID=A0ABW4U4D4_9SPHN